MRSASGLLLMMKVDMIDTRTDRVWGYYRVLHEDGKEVKVKELTVNPGCSLSMQRHFHRSEHWFVSEGTATVYLVNDKKMYTKFQHVHINKLEWHKLCNETDRELRIIEIQYGNNCVEEDIERNP